MKKLLVIGYVWPEPKSSAAGSRMMQLIEAFQSRGTHITYASPAEPSPHAVDLPAQGIVVENIALNCSSFDQFVSTLNPDVVLFDRFMMEEQFGWRVEKFCPQAVRILDTEDLHSLRHARHQALKQQTQCTHEHLFSDIAQREIAAILRSDLTLMISEYEMSLLQDTFKVDPSLLHYCPFMLNPQQSTTFIDSNPTREFERRQHFVSIGNFRHEPNWDAVRYLKTAIWPGIRKVLPQAQCHIYGGYPPKKATQLHNDQQGFLVKGWAEDAHDVLFTSRVLLAPLRFGAGLKGKLIDAALTGTPAVTTSIGAEGMYGELTPPVCIANAAEDFIHEAVNLYENAQHWQSLHQACEAVIPTRFNGPVLQKLLLERVDDVLQTLTQHRLNNFTGAMLRHHSMKSTQYMAQWIEAKNRVPTDKTS